MGSIVANKINLENLAAIYQELMVDKHITQANKVLDLIEKIKDQSFVISFSGHFSAGKSSMINQLLGEDLLPESPIPTSANIVKISAGSGYARVYFNKDEPMEYKEPYDLETIKSYCKDGDAITKVEISKDTTVIPANVSIMDTPGIDSSNDADRVMTESSLHVVDVMFYVMDYNHVQSEVNLQFLQEMQQRSKPIYIVINQMDKHREEELSFQQFDESVKQSLAQWGIIPEALFYTSLKSPNHELNQFSRVQNNLKELMKKKEDFVEQTVVNAVDTIIQEHKNWLQEEVQSKKEALQDELAGIEKIQLDPFLTKAKLDEVKQLPKKAEKEFRSIVDTTLNNAYLMPFNIREKAEAVLESEQNNFKVGLLFSKKKTDQERAERLQSFYSSFIETAEAAVQWKLRDKMKEWAKQFNVLTDQRIQTVIQDFSVSFPRERLTELIKSGAKNTNAYLLVYTDDVANEYKRQAKKEAYNILEQCLRQLEAKAKTETSRLEDSLRVSNRYEQLQLEIDQLDTGIEDRTRTLTELLTNDLSDSSFVDLVEKKLQTRKKQFRQGQGYMLSDTTERAEQQAKHQTQDRAEETMPLSVEDTIFRMNRAANLLKERNGFQSIRKNLLQKTDRLENRNYTVALFGAFSAGKSSFANALLGENILPVSPNPTTAAINKICPPTTENPHGTVRVKLKSLTKIVEDVSYIFEESLNEIKNIEVLLSWVKSRKNSVDLEHKHRSFLEALITGYDLLGEQLGKQMQVTLTEFPDYVAKESLACYVEWMELYYDCPLTRHGITIVDTPGADSVNSRHTDVSFDYMKEADAILFVTYYNHAFSKADREFLTQLGRVKDAFSLDKMFFIVNAADLAKTDSELKIVTDYVRDQLSPFGIYFPRMFPVSSHQAMKEKQGIIDGESGLSSFEKSFYHFIEEELSEIMVRSSLFDMKRALNVLDRYITSASLNRNEKMAVRAKYVEQKQRIENKMKTFANEAYEHAISQKIEKQVYYVRERVMIQFSDTFKENLNPATIQGNGKTAKLDVQKNLSRFIHELGFQLSQELQAVSLRIESFLTDKAQQFNEEMMMQTCAGEEELAFPDVEEKRFETQRFSEHLQIKENIVEQAASKFKNTKAFFEKNEKEVMKTYLKEVLYSPITDYLESNRKQVEAFYLKQWEQFVLQIKDQALDTAEQYFDGLLYTLSDNMDVSELKTTYKQLNELIPWDNE
ncbi:dynamin family protein [Aquibacillus sp. 3ASR75-11]|uniref:Dynamin family protein n=1 Tax=Terrihalobacillus insolitus TaxID=2950438 RepID=A0A9X3WUF6_9BACI|nr:dynamin family protein [Terrihalobacillus insolitus]MDC3425900.1 dynamin family protein [Terrihalobacillus insolitus]